MDGFIRKVNQKINLPEDACPDFAFLKHGLLKVHITDLVGIEFNFPVNTIKAMLTFSHFSWAGLVL